MANEYNDFRDEQRDAARRQEQLVQQQIAAARDQASAVREANAQARRRAAQAAAARDRGMATGGGTRGGTLLTGPLGVVGGPMGSAGTLLGR